MCNIPKSNLGDAMMRNKKSKFNFVNRTTLIIVAIVLMISSAIILLWQGNKNSMQSISAMQGIDIYGADVSSIIENAKIKFHALNY